ncbi:protein disulfide-isomerase [Chrysochromulina tobinii]|uniref:Protein disulfide-isomerase n=1 Tax=Chrysochromulina tobinii TaxID=1460289 RepID=A0A0M0JN32_9EUKA|nr:protein disulfide-isomerase [Chrysochromulina tobinii]|eukprot:KOO27966.1 protein disulfide-isomerase [Chrysochromulina sp. CCMP291]
MHGTILLVAVAVLATPAVAAVFNLDDGNFDTDLRGAGGSFVKFYAPWCSHCKKLAPVWHELSERDLGNVRVCHLDLTRVSTASTIKERFAIRAFPTLLYFPPASEAIYKYSGKRELEALTTYAKGGWKETDAFDPSKEPPLPPRQSFTEQLWSLVTGKGRWLFGFMGISIAIGIGVLLCSTGKAPARQALPKPPDAAAAASSPDRTFGNVPLSQQQRGTPSRSFDNVPLSQQRAKAD